MVAVRLAQRSGSPRREELRIEIKPSTMENRTWRSPVSADFVRGLKCRLCGKPYPKEALNFCTDDFGPLEVNYDYEAVSRTLSRQAIMSRPNSMWRYRELLPI